MSKLGTRRRHHPFRITDPVSGRVVRARLLAPPQDIEGCLAAWEIVGTSGRTPAETDIPLLVAA